MTNHTETVNTLALRNGDVVITWGMRVQISNRTEHTRNPRTVVHFDGLILNPDDVNPALVPPSWRVGDYWAIQGNELATWRREIA